MTKWFKKDLKQLFNSLDSSKEGLSSEEASEKRKKYGRNEINDKEATSPFKILLAQFQDFLIYILILAALLSLGIGLLPGHSPEYTEAGLILLILVANGLFGFIQDYKAEKSIQALKDLSTPKATVLRDGKRKEIDSRELVPGDIIFLEQGDAVPGDARIIESHNLETDESALTGESSSVSKTPGKLNEETSLADRENMIYMNTHVVKGRGKAVVVETGMKTQVGGIATQIEEADERKTPFQREVDELGKKIGYGIFTIIGLVALVQFGFTSAGPLTVLLVAITLAVAAVPEGLPAVVTLTLALGSKKMLKKGALVRRLPVVESLGSVDFIVTDKTGTLTEGVMTVEKVFFSGKEYSTTGTGLNTDGRFQRNGKTVNKDLRPLLQCGLHCNNAQKAPEDDEKEFFGGPTEIALLVSAYKAGLTEKKGRKKSIPFSSDRKRMTVVTKDNNAYMKGAPETVLERCNRIMIDGEEKELTDERKQEILDKNNEFARDALRVLGFARKQEIDLETEEEIESSMLFLGLQGMIDPPREEVQEAVEDCRSAGIRVVMATGDNIETAKAIGEEIGFKSDNALTGNEVEGMTEAELRDEVENTEIFARVSPEHKVRILHALQDNGHNVAMTGDGVNDAPALKNSDVGIAMGRRGTDVAKQSSDMVLQDDNFVTIRDAIAEGRGIFDNTRKFVNYLLSANAGEVLAVFFGILIGTAFFPDIFSSSNSGALILTPIMLLWINFVTDGLPALALGADPKSDGIMKRDPRGKNEPVINRRMMASIAGIGIIMTLTGLPIFFQALSTDLIAAQTALFTFLVLVEMIRIQIIRKRYGQSILSNKWLTGALGSSILLQLLVLYTPLSAYFKTAWLGAESWIILVSGIAVFWILSIGMGEILDRYLPGQV
ncbi:MAG: haloacid dehalogenase [Nanohaloarchaea archaeon SW_4_43_9]|nr:MAG: haloacid dehalogenase [Nanohaloarchaea archaeon SW_4_43_9]